MQDLNFTTGRIKAVECAKEGYELIKSDYWLLFAIWLVGGMIGGISLFIASGAMTAGTFYCYLKKIDGKPIKFDDLWKGMQWFLPGLVIMMIIIVPLLMVYLLIYVPVIIAAVMGSRLSQDELIAMLVGAVAIDLVLIVIMVCVHTLLVFAFPLIVDRNVGAFKAMTTSARAVVKNLGGVAGMIGVNFVLVFCGYALLCVGIYFVIPIIIAANLVAYRRVFPRLEHNFGLPPSDVYRGLQNAR
ncbi:MAG: hypothetical protein ABR530_07680 [Pyrinomonadaceae bacterium]